MKITRLKITNYRGVRNLDMRVPDKGIVVKGKNRQGKTSVLGAIQAALVGRGVGPENITLGADASEILVDLDAITIRQSITQRSSSVSVIEGGGAWSKPRTRLAELLGDTAIDPLDFFLADGATVPGRAKRRKAILDAMPLVVTQEMMQRWTGTTDTFDLSGHGLEVLERVRKVFYDRRTVANKECTDARAKLDAARRETVTTREALQGTNLRDLAPLAMCESALAAAEEELRTLHARREATQNANAGQRAAVERIAALTAEASRLRMTAQPPRVNLAALKAELQETRERIATLQKAQAELEAQITEVAEVDARNTQILHDAQRAEDQARAMQETISATAAPGPTDEEIDQAAQRQVDAAAALEAAKKKAVADAAFDRESEARRAAEAAENAAGALDRVVDTLTHTAPHELAQASDLIPGLSFEGDAILLDGKPLDGLCGAEQMEFAVELARRANAKTKILVVDGLERLDADGLNAFIKSATRDDYQLLATRVSDGEMLVEAIES